MNGFRSVFDGWWSDPSAALGMMGGGAAVNPLLSGYNFVTGNYTLPTPAFSLWHGTDGINFSAVPGSTYNPGTGYVCREPNILYSSGTYWMAHSSKGDTPHSTFGLAKSTDLNTWTKVTEVDASALVDASYPQCWSPKWFIDDDESIHIVAFLWNSTTGNGKPFEIHPTSADMTAWSAPVEITGTWTQPAIDFSLVKIGAKYYMWYKDDTGDYLLYATSTVLTGSYTPKNTGNWAGFGNHYEGPALMQTGGNSWRVYADRYASDGRESYSNNSYGFRPSTFSAMALLTPDQSIYHGNCIDMRHPVWPNIASVSAETGSQGDTITITGGHFQSGATATYDGVAMTDVTVVSTTSITAKLGAAAGAAAYHTLIIANPGGWSKTYYTGDMVNYNSFTGANGTNLVGQVPDIGPTGSALGPAVWAITSNQASMSGGGVTENHLLWDAGSADVDIQVTLSKVVNNAGLALRSVGQVNYLLLTPVTGKYELYAVTSPSGGTYTLLGSYSVAPADNDVIRVTLVGQDITVYINGTSRITATSTQNLLVTKHGLRVGGNLTTARWDNFSIKQL